MVSFSRKCRNLKSFSYLISTAIPYYFIEICFHFFKYTGWFKREKSIFCEVILLVIVRKNVYMNACLTLNGHWDRAVWISRPDFVWVLFVELCEEPSLQKKVGYTRRILRWHCGCSSPHKEKWRSAQTENTRTLQRRSQVHWGWRWDFRKFIMNSKTSVISV
jgi:hypothetical protein